MFRRTWLPQVIREVLNVSEFFFRNEMSLKAEYTEIGNGNTVIQMQ